MTRWLIVELVIASICFLVLYIATRLLLLCSHCYIENERGEKHSNNVLSQIYAAFS